jgi:hypothetical protein
MYTYNQLSVILEVKKKKITAMLKQRGTSGLSPQEILDHFIATI